MVDLSLAQKDQLLAALPPDIRSAFVTALQYYQVLKDSNYTSTAPPPTAAINTVNAYGEATCGFNFES
jgi:hypothetical protein